MLNRNTELDIRELLEQLGISYDRYLQWETAKERTFAFPLTSQDLQVAEDKAAKYWVRNG